jgi:hypothetical protein
MPGLLLTDLLIYASCQRVCRLGLGHHPPAGDPDPNHATRANTVSGVAKISRQGSERHGQARPAGNHPATAFPEGLPFRQKTQGPGKVMKLGRDLRCHNCRDVPGGSEGGGRDPGGTMEALTFTVVCREGTPARSCHGRCKKPARGACRAEDRDARLSRGRGGSPGSRRGRRT